MPGQFWQETDTSEILTANALLDYNFSGYQEKHHLFYLSLLFPSSEPLLLSPVPIYLSLLLVAQHSHMETSDMTQHKPEYHI